MGNIGNLNGDNRSNISDAISSRENSCTSRIQQDLSSSPHQEDYMEEADVADFPMIRRAAGKVPHVCVVGAGVAGLRCADVLLRHGVKVTILEGRDRLGGRVSLNSIKQRHYLLNHL